MDTIIVPLPGIIETFYQAQNKPVPADAGELVFVFEHDAPTEDIDFTRDAAQNGSFHDAIREIGRLRTQGLSFRQIKKLLMPEQYWTVERRPSHA